MRFPGDAARDCSSWRAQLRAAGDPRGEHVLTRYDAMDWELDAELRLGDDARSGSETEPSAINHASLYLGHLVALTSVFRRHALEQLLG